MEVLEASTRMPGPPGDFCASSSSSSRKASLFSNVVVEGTYSPLVTSLDRIRLWVLLLCGG